MKTRVFIDGKEGTTGLQIYERFQNRNDVEIMLIDEDNNKSVRSFFHYTFSFTKAQGRERESEDDKLIGYHFSLPA